MASDSLPLAIEDVYRPKMSKETWKSLLALQETKNVFTDGASFLQKSERISREVAAGSVIEFMVHYEKLAAFFGSDDGEDGAIDEDGEVDEVDEDGEDEKEVKDVGIFDSKEDEVAAFPPPLSLATIDDGKDDANAEEMEESNETEPECAPFAATSLDITNGSYCSWALFLRPLNFS
jgi:hypothetical protein